MVTTVHILPLEGVFDTGLANLLDVFHLANNQARANGQDTCFDIRLVGVASEIRSGNGLSMPLGGTIGETPDWVLIPALGTFTEDELVQRLGESDIGLACALLRDYAKRGARIGAACTASFLLAESGLLRGGKATTSWWLADLFHARYPDVVSDESGSLVQSGPCLTAGAAMAHLDLGLWLVRQTSPILAEQIARYLVVDSRPSQPALTMPCQLSVNDPVVQRFEAWARAHLGEGFSLSVAAKASGASERTLTRRLRSVLGKSALAYFQELRIERAVHMLKTTRASIDDVAAAVGYADGKTLGMLLRKKTGLGARALRERSADRVNLPG